MLQCTGVAFALKANNNSKDILYVPAPHRLEPGARSRPCFRDRYCQSAEWPPARVVHLRAAWYCGNLAAAALVGQTAARLATIDPSSTLGLPHRLWVTGAAVCHAGAWIRHLVGRRR